MRHDSADLRALNRIVRPYACSGAAKRTAIEKKVSAFLDEYGTDALLHAARRNAGRSRAYRWIMAALPFAAFMFVMLVVILNPGDLYRHLTACMLALPVIGCTCAVLHASQRGVVMALARCGDIRAVAYLASAARSDERSLNALARAGLIRLMPGLRACDAALLGRTQRGELYVTLRAAWVRHDTELAAAILTGLAQMGDTGVLPDMRRMAQPESRFAKHRANRLIAEKAAALLPDLERIASARRSHGELLRAAAAAPGGDAALLRAASAASGVDDNLLRAGGSAADEAPCAQKSAQ